MSGEAQHHFESQLREQWEGTGFSGARALVAVSGGADSVALLRALLAIVEDRTLISVAHFNHGWRGEESDADERFVKELCESQKVQCRVGVVAEDTARPSNRSEEEARERRYAFLQETAY
ncbi:MAG: ATP-binding protein, partial [Planctomycetota bacterium]